MTDDEQKEFQRRCAAFSAIEEAAILAAIDKMNEVLPELRPDERTQELTTALVAGAWRTLLMANTKQETPYSNEQMREIFIEKYVTRFVENSPTLPENISLN